MKLKCRTCGVEITSDLIELKDKSLINIEDGQDYIPKGFYLIEDQVSSITTVHEEKGTIVINIQDLINSEYHTNPSRLNGCCGYDGLDGFNRVCINHHEIGTEKSDCWMPHSIILQPNLVEFVE